VIVNRRASPPFTGCVVRVGLFARKAGFMVSSSRGW
jgi:hypothetical protein